MTCPSCGADAGGSFCSACGARLETAPACRGCGAPLDADARFCTRCGARAGLWGSPFRWMLPAVVAIIALAGAYLLGRGGRTDDGVAVATSSTFAPPGSGRAGSPPPLTGSMREQADRLFERIMQARARGDSADVRFFLPMALQAYGAAGELDADGLFHLGLLHLEQRSAADVAATAARIEAIDRDHLFGIALRAEAGVLSGDRDASGAAYERFRAAFDPQISRGLPEYEMHRPALDEYRQRADDAERR